MIIPNKTDLERGDLIAKARDVYCEELDQREVANLRLEDIHDEDDVANVVGP